jgi:hypothetical protein
VTYQRGAGIGPAEREELGPAYFEVWVRAASGAEAVAKLSADIGKVRFAVPMYGPHALSDEQVVAGPDAHFFVHLGAQHHSLDRGYALARPGGAAATDITSAE